MKQGWGGVRATIDTAGPDKSGAGRNTALLVLMLHARQGHAKHREAKLPGV